MNLVGGIFFLFSGVSIFFFLLGRVTREYAVTLLGYDLRAPWWLSITDNHSTRSYPYASVIWKPCKKPCGRFSTSTQHQENRVHTLIKKTS